MEKEIEKYERIIHLWVNRFTRSIKGETKEDLFQEGLICLWQTIEERSEGILTCTMEEALATKLKQTYINMYEKQVCKKRKVYMSEEPLDENKLIVEENPWDSIDIFLELPSYLREVAELLLYAPEEFLDSIRMGGFHWGMTHYLKKFKGWNNHKINKVLKLISE